jgi:hypothetical protein
MDWEYAGCRRSRRAGKCVEPRTNTADRRSCQGVTGQVARRLHDMCRGPRALPILPQPLRRTAPRNPPRVNLPSNNTGAVFRARMARSASRFSAIPYWITRRMKRLAGADNTPTETTPSHPGHLRRSSRLSRAKSPRLIGIVGWPDRIPSSAPQIKGVACNDGASAQISSTARCCPRFPHAGTN